MPASRLASAAVPGLGLALLLLAAAPSVPAQAGCENFWTTTTSIEAGSDGGFADVTLHGPRGCSYALKAEPTVWLRVEPASITLRDPQDTFSIEWQPNTYGVARSGSVSVEGGGQTQFITVRQGVPCTYKASKANFYYDSDAHGGSFGLDTGPRCTWTASTADPWISVGGSHTGPQTVFFSIMANTSPEGRTGRIDAGSVPVLVHQAGAGKKPPADPHEPFAGGDPFGLSGEDPHEAPGPEAWGVLAALGGAAWVRRGIRRP